jgi:hypothetical protein
MLVAHEAVNGSPLERYPTVGRSQKNCAWPYDRGIRQLSGETRTNHPGERHPKPITGGTVSGMISRE